MEHSPPIFLKHRSSNAFIIGTITLAIFTDFFLYGLIIPSLPFILTNRLHIPPQEVQQCTSLLLTSYALACLIACLPSGLIIDRLKTNRLPFLFGLLSLLASTIILAVGQTMTVLVAARALQGISAAIVWTVGLVILQDTVPSNRLGATIGTVTGFVSIGAFIAPVIGGIFYDKLGNEAVFGLALGLLGVDLVMRGIMIERRVAEKWGVDYENNTDRRDSKVSENETSPLLSTPALTNNANNAIPNNEEDRKYILPSPLPQYLPKPLLYILFTSPRLLTCTLSSLLLAALVAINNATIPIQANLLFNLTSFSSGLFFIPLLAPSLIIGPLAGHLIDKYGTKLPSALGFLLLSIPVFLLRLPHTGGSIEITKYAIILLFVGIATAFVGPVFLVETTEVVERYHKMNPEAWGEKGPFASMFAWHCVLTSAGLTLGPVLVVGMNGWGYGGLMGWVAGICVCLGVLCFCFLGDELTRKNGGGGEE